MIKNIPAEKIEESIVLDNNRIVLTVDAFDEIFNNDPMERSRNLFLIDQDGNVLWRVHSDFDDDGGRFVSISLRENTLYGIRWDCGEYLIDQETGFATPGRFLK